MSCNNCQGYCERHAIYKSAAQADLCQKDETLRNYLDMLAEERRQGLVGERMKKALTSVGITKERYTAVKLAIGLEPSCDCDGRRQWWNKVHAMAKGTFRL